MHASALQRYRLSTLLSLRAEVLWNQSTEVVRLYPV